MNTPASEIAWGEPKRMVPFCSAGAGAAPVAAAGAGSGPAANPTAASKTNTLRTRWTGSADPFMLRLHRAALWRALARARALPHSELPRSLDDAMVTPPGLGPAGAQPFQVRHDVPDRAGRLLAQVVHPAARLIPHRVEVPAPCGQHVRGPGAHDTAIRAGGLAARVPSLRVRLHLADTVGHQRLADTGVPPARLPPVGAGTSSGDDCGGVQRAAIAFPRGRGLCRIGACGRLRPGERRGASGPDCRSEDHKVADALLLGGFCHPWPRYGPAVSRPSGPLGRPIRWSPALQPVPEPDARISSTLSS